ncbi:MAG: LPS assembly protein LptD, partial [Planctomycetaceae bacterium]|nr:LPS assembly protein LptD [Planctomycetaceae bacterium]
DELELDLDEGLGIARGAKIEVAGKPVFYSPWMSFPLDDRRRTGFLWPDIGSDSKGGVDISAPVYFNLAPNYDLLYSPRYIQERGVNHEMALGYLNRYVQEWKFSGAYMAGDDRYEDEFPNESDHDRWYTGVKHNGLFESRWRTRVNYGKVSDADYLRDLETSSLDSRRRTALLQLGSVDYLGDQWLVNLDVQQFQSLADDINDDYQKLPQLTAQYRPKGTPFKLDPILLAQYSNFDTDDTNRVKGER